MVELKKKVTLRTKATESSDEVQKPQVTLKKKQPVSEPVLPSPPSTGGEEGPKRGKGKWYAAALAGLLVLGGGGYYLSQQGENEQQSVVAVAGNGQLDESAKEESTGGNLNEQNQEGETPANAAIAENPSGDTSSGEAPAVPSPKADAAPPSSNSTPSSPSVSLPVQDKPKENSAQTKQVIVPSNATGTIEEEAKEVIRGKYGNGDVRKRNLGDRYAEIQGKVNEMYRNGQVQ